MKMVIQQAWTSVIGLASTTIGILKFTSILHIPTLDALVHIVTGGIFIGGAWINEGQLGPHYCGYYFQTNWLINLTA